MKSADRKRRDFFRSCLGLMALSLHRRSQAGQLGPMKTYSKSRLVDIRGKAFTAAQLPIGETYIFHYPFNTTPCFLINLGQSVPAGAPLRTESGEEYRWPGGVGGQHSIVAFSAICAHKMTHPAKSVSFINYRPERLKYINKDKQPEEGSHLIYCCSEKSVYDARDGARVLGGPAKQPLAAIGLDYDGNNDELFATSTFGGEMFQQFFEKFTARLQLEYRITDVNGKIGDRTTVQSLKEFSETQYLC